MALAKHYAGRTYVYEDVLDSETHRDSSSNLMRPRLSYEKILRVDESADSSKAEGFRKSCNGRSTIIRHLDSNSLASALIYCLESHNNNLLIPLPLLGSFFELIPARLGHNDALDHSVATLCSIYLKQPAFSYDMDTELYRKYAKALSSVRHFIEEDFRRMESETLCASILLQMCEVSVQTTSRQFRIDSYRDGTVSLKCE